MADLGQIGAGLSGGLAGLLEAYKMRLQEQQEAAKTRQSGFNQLGSQDRLAETERHNRMMEAIRAAAAGRANLFEPYVTEMGGVQYLVRPGRDGQPIFTAQKGSAPAATEAEGNIASLDRAPEYAAAAENVPFGNVPVLGNLMRRVAQTPVIGAVAGAVSPRIAAMQEKERAFVTPYLQSGGGKALTPSEQATFKGRVQQIALQGRSQGGVKAGLADLVKEISGKTESAIGTGAAGPQTPTLKAKLQRAIEANRRAGVLPGGGGGGGGWEPTTYRGRPARRRPAQGGGWEVEIDEE